MKTQPTTATRHPAKGRSSSAPARVPVKPEILRWARERASLEISDLSKAFPKIEEWETGETSPTPKQLDDFAKKVQVPIGYLFLPEPLDDPFPANDFRTFGKRQKRRPSPNLLDTIYLMQLRSEYLRDERIYQRMDPIPFVGCASLRDDPKEVAHNMREALGFTDGWGSQFKSWHEAVEGLRYAIEQIGIMAVINGFVGNNTSRKLDKDEFLGFVLCDEYAPLIFVNGADHKSRQMFTLVHKLAHIWLGMAGEGVSLTRIDDLTPNHKVEEFCSKAAAEFLVPAQDLRNHWKQAKNTDAQYETLAGIFKVSPIVIARRALDEKLITRKTYLQFCADRSKQWQHNKRNGASRGDFYKAQNARVGAMFAKAIFYAAKAGRVGLRDAYNMTNLSGETLREYLRRIGVGN